MKTRQELLSQLAAAITDYRPGEDLPRGPAHVDRWISQFDDSVQDSLLDELSYVFDKVYISRTHLEGVWSSLVDFKEITGPDSASFWNDAEFLRIQRGGASQLDLLEVFDKLLTERFGIDTSNCKTSSNTFVYIDDGLFSGNRIITDIRNWLTHAPSHFTLHIIVIVAHSYGKWRAEQEINRLIANEGKSANLRIWPAQMFEDRKIHTEESDVLRPTRIPNDPDTEAYAAGLAANYPLNLRTGASIGPFKLFSSPQRRELLEQEFLKKGVAIRKICPHLGEAMRPLGFQKLKTLGFGSLLVTYRNCPNNCPLAFWVGAPWYPLFPRKTNGDAESERMLSQWLK